MKILLMPNLDKKNAATVLRETVQILDHAAVRLLMDSRFSEQFSDLRGVQFAPFAEQLSDCDLCVAIGGDGTIIHTAKHAITVDKPVLGINAGRLGFLATLEGNQLERLKALPEGGFEVENRMLLQIVHRHGKEETTYYALNDAVISKGALSRMIDLDIHCKGKKVGSYRADGMIAATPTGSTAYSLSAGGPIVDPQIDCIILTPISSHSLFSRSILFHHQSVVTVSPVDNSGQEIFLTVDGEEGIAVGLEDRLFIQKSPVSLKLINLTGKRFYEVLGEKLVSRAEPQTV